MRTNIKQLKKRMPSSIYLSVFNIKSTLLILRNFLEKGKPKTKKRNINKMMEQNKA